MPDNEEIRHSFEFEGLSGIESAAHQLLSISHDHKIWLFYGEMGAGKTSIIKEICRQLGVEDSMTSPTFSLVNEYRDAKDNPIYHFDFFRLESPEEALDIGCDEYFYSGNLCLIEWPELIEDLLPPDYIRIKIEVLGTDRRKLVIQHHEEKKVRL